MRPLFVLLVLGARLFSGADAIRAQDSQSADQERKARIEKLFTEAADYCKGQHYELCLGSLDAVIKLANTPDSSNRKNDAALYRATNEVIALRSLISKQAQVQVQVVTELTSRIKTTADRFWTVGDTADSSEQSDQRRTLANLSVNVDQIRIHLQTHAFARDHVSALAGLNRNRGSVTRLAGQVCSAGSRGTIGSAVDDIEVDHRQALDIDKQAQAWQDERSGRLQDSPLNDDLILWVADSLTELAVHSNWLESKIAESEKSRTQTLLDLERAIATLRAQADRLGPEQQKLETLIALYRRSGEVVRFGEDLASSWQWSAPSESQQRAYSQIASLESMLEKLKLWDAAKARASAKQDRADLERLVKQNDQISRIIAETDAAAQSITAAVIEIRRERDRARACFDSLTRRAASAAPATPSKPTATVPPPAVSATPQRTDGAGSGKPQTPHAKTAAPVQSPAPAAQAAAPAAPPPVDPTVAGGIKIQGPTTRIPVGQRVRFVATDYGNRPYANVTWTSFDEELLSIDSQGYATGLKTGSVLIHAKLDDEKNATLSVDVVEATQASAPAQPATTAATPAPAPSSGFQVGPMQAGPAGQSTNNSPSVQTNPDGTAISGNDRSGTSLLGVDAPSSSTQPTTQSTGGFEVGAMTAGPDTSQQPPPGGGSTPPPPGGGPGGSGGPNPQRGPQQPGPQQTRTVAGQPAAYHIFAAGSRLGWASGLGQYSIGPADATIIEHLQVAGEHVMWANRESYPPVKAWPNWTTNRSEIRSWADRLSRNPVNATRRQIPIRANSLKGTLAEELRYQTMGTPEHVATCDAAYMNLGYALAYAQQTLAIAVEAAKNGDAALAQEAQRDGMSHLQTSSRILSDYERIISLTGRCADLRDVRTQIDTIIRSDARDTAHQSTATGVAWKLAADRIAALRGRQIQTTQTSQTLPNTTSAAAGQPAAYHIFAAGSRLGWASGLGQYSIGPADRTIIEHLQVAGEHVMWANRESYPPVKAWPNWTTNRSEIRSWADGLARDPRDATRRQIPIRANSLTGILADELRYQTMGTPEHVATCDAAYMHLGYELGYAHQSLAVAVEAAQNGDAELAQRAQRDGMSHLQTSSRILSNYERVISLTGRCADLRDVRTQIDTIIRSDARDMTRQLTATASAWRLACERIAALRGGPQTQTPPTPPGTGARQQAAPPTQASGPDAGNLEGYWVNSRRVYRFVKQGDEYVGLIEHAEAEMAIPSETFGIRAGVEVFRLKRMGPNLYKGTYHKRRAHNNSPPYEVPVDRLEPVWVSVLGAFAFGWGPGTSTAYLSPLFTFYPPRTVAEVMGAPDSSQSQGMIRVLNRSGAWIFPDGRPARLSGSDANGLWSNYLFPGESIGGMSKNFWFIASGKNADGKPVFMVFPDYDRAVAGGMSPEGDPNVGWYPMTREDFRIDSLSREYLNRGGFSIIFGPANIKDIAIELGKYPQDVTDRH